MSNATEFWEIIMGTSKSKKLKDLTALFRKLGAVEPEGWARSEIEDGIPQFPRFVFLKAAWLEVVPEGDTGWINDAIKVYEEDPNASYAEAGRALKRLLELGASKGDITDLVRSMQAQTMFGICTLLDGVGGIPFLEDGMPDICFMLLNVPEEGNGEPVQVDGLHESAYEVDPTYREMRPR